MDIRLIPVITEKSMNDAKSGNYTFLVDRNSNKFQIKNAVKSLFDVDVIAVRTVNYKKRVKKDVRGRKVSLSPRKKAYVFVKEGQKIDLFEEKKGKK